MTLQTDHYHSLVCNGRVDNVVAPVCGARSPGRWHDADAMEEEMVQLGWTKPGRGHLCPACSRAAASTEPTEPVKPRKTRTKLAVADVSGDTQPDGWEAVSA